MEDKFKQKVRNLIEICDAKYETYHNIEQAIKLIINSSYGSFGTSTFIFYNKLIAESITTTGKHMTLSAKAEIDKYFREKWVDDKELHDKLGVNLVSTSSPNISTVYAQTDSVYTSLYDACMMTDFFSHKVWRNDAEYHCFVSQAKVKTKEDAVKFFNVDPEYIHEVEAEGYIFCLMMYENHLKKFFCDLFDSIGERDGVENVQSFEFESYAESGIWLGKNRYVQDIRWSDPDVVYEPFTKIKPTGIELADMKTPDWCKKQLKGFLKWIMSCKQEDLTQTNINNKISEIKKAFKLQQPKDIAWTVTLNVYDNYVIDDKENIKLRPKSSASTQGGAIYNYLLKKNNLENRFSRISSGDKCSFFYIKPISGVYVHKGVNKNDKETKNSLFDDDDAKVDTTQDANLSFSLESTESFSIPIGVDLNKFPMVNIDYNKQFEAVLLSPINRFLVAMNFKPYDNNPVKKFSFF